MSKILTKFYNIIWKDLFSGVLNLPQDGNNFLVVALISDKTAFQSAEDALDILKIYRKKIGDESDYSMLNLPHIVLFFGFIIEMIFCVSISSLS